MVKTIKFKFQMKTYKVKRLTLLKLIALVLLTSLGISCGGIQKADEVEELVNTDFTVSIPTSANSWVVDNPGETTSIITENGISNWKSKESKIRAYFKVENTGKIFLGLKGNVSEGKSLIKLTLNGVSKLVEISNTAIDTIPIGVFNVKESGYQIVELEGINKTGAAFAEIGNILIGGEAINGSLYYVKDDVYWGRRGPSVHLSYEKSEKVGDVVWFYNEVTVPENNDVIGSYFMANGFGEGYFGMQVNSENERRFLFSVWSPYSTDDPSSIPQDQRITLLKKGANVTTGKFGNEGSGGQSYRKYMWKAGNTYKFLLKGEPSVNNSTDYTAYVFAPEIGKWELIASFRRPKTSTYLTRPHSFLENFITEMGDETRKVYFTNQWVYDTGGNWHELTKAKFTADATARKDARLDYGGGVENGKFYLKNCGFFSENTVMDSMFKKEGENKAPTIDFKGLP